MPFNYIIKRLSRIIKPISPELQRIELDAKIQKIKKTIMDVYHNPKIYNDFLAVIHLMKEKNLSIGKQERIIAQIESMFKIGKANNLGKLLIKNKKKIK